MTDEGGSPLPGVGVEVDYMGGWRLTHTDGAGLYEFRFEPGIGIGRFAGFSAPGLVYTILDGFDSNVQLLPIGPSEIVQNLRLRRVRRIDVGQSITVTVEPDSSLCSDLEGLFAYGYRCELVEVTANMAGTLFIDIRPEAAGATSPTVFWLTTGNYAGLITRPTPSTASIPIRGGVYTILAGIPVGSPSQRLTVFTSMK